MLVILSCSLKYLLIYRPSGLLPVDHRCQWDPVQRLKMPMYDSSSGAGNIGKSGLQNQMHYSPYLLVLCNFLSFPCLTSSTPENSTMSCFVFEVSSEYCPKVLTLVCTPSWLRCMRSAQNVWHCILSAWVLVICKQEQRRTL